jgi:hypothetical protein
MPSGGFPELGTPGIGVPSPNSSQELECADREIVDPESDGLIVKRGNRVWRRRYGEADPRLLEPSPEANQEAPSLKTRQRRL